MAVSSVSATPDPARERDVARNLDFCRSAPSIFLHALWRSGSTYVWSRFRALDELYAFYDPLNIDLAKLTPARLARGTTAASPHLRHPRLQAPYFAEFTPLLTTHGVRGYSRALAIERLFLAPDEAHPALHAYLSALIDHAREQARAPVLGVTLGFGRIDWMAAQLGGAHIHVDRAPAPLWGSYMDQREAGNPWFVARWLIAIEANRRHPLMRPLAEALPLRTPAQAMLTSRKSFYRRLAARLAPQEIYRLTVYVWALAALKGLAFCDAIIDIDQIGEPAYRARVAGEVRALTGLSVDFEGARTPAARGPTLDRSERGRIEDEVLRSIPLGARLAAIRHGAARRTARLAPEKRDLLSALIA